MECDVCGGKNREVFNCDGCRTGLCRTCAGLTSSEVKVLQLNTRVMIFHCKRCLTFETCTLLGNTIEDKTQIIAGKDEIISLLKKQIEDLENVQKNSNTVSMTYSSALSTSGKQVQGKVAINSNSPSLIIKPKLNQDIKKIETDLKQNIKPSDLKIAVRGTRSTSNGHLIVKCRNKQDLDALKKEAEKKLTGYEIEIPKLRRPRIKIPGYDGKQISKDELESCIREQNQFIDQKDELKVTFLRKVRDRYTIFAECSSSLFQRFMNVGKVFIGWERYPVYEDISVTRCFNCQEPFHKGDSCPNQPCCEKCSGAHGSRDCRNDSQKQCKNCINTNSKHKLNYKTDHGANDPDCPSYRYLLSVLRSKIDYGTING